MIGFDRSCTDAFTSFLRHSASFLFCINFSKLRLKPRFGSMHSGGRNRSWHANCCLSD